MMYSTSTFNDQIPTGYYGNHSLDYQSNLINGVNSNIKQEYYPNVNHSIIKQSPSHSPLLDDDEPPHKRKKNQEKRNYRKVRIEKRRRDRINSSLNELRSLVPTANEKQGSAKLEKAEILQMTVDHLKALNSKGFDTFSFDPHTFATKHLIMGFKECAEQVARHLSSTEGLAFNEPIRLRLISHLQRYITQREYDLKSNNSNGIAWNPNLFLTPTSTSSNQTNGNNINTTSTSSSLNAQQMLNSTTTSLSPITTLTHSSLSSHSNSSITSNSSSLSSYQQQLNQQNDSTPTSPLCDSPVSNSSLNISQLPTSQLSNQLSASQLLNQHSYTDSNNSTSSSSQNNSLHSESNNQSTSQSSNVSNVISNAINSINTSDDVQNNLLLMGPPPPRPFKVTLPLNSVSPNSPNSSSTELTYTNMHPCSNTYSAHHSINTNSYPPNSFSNSLSNPYAAVASAVAHHSNPIHHTPYLNNFNNLNSAFAYGTSVPMSGASVVTNVVSLPNHSSAQSAVNQQYSATKYRPWGSEMKIITGSY